MENTRDRVLEAALRLFSENGYRGATTAEIARQAGVAEGTIYRYFRDKKELFLACVEPVIQEAIRRENTLPREGSPREILRRRIIERVRVIRENLPVFHILFTESRFHPEIASILLQQVSTSISAQEKEAIQRAVESGAFRRPPNPLIMSVGLTSAIWAMVAVGPAADHLFADWPYRPSYARLEEDVADFFADALMAEANT
ncbi:MAG: TetR/AcrR family transcriptional regulator [Bacillota bacterium]